MPLSGELDRCQVAERAVGSMRIVVDPPGFDLGAGVLERRELRMRTAGSESSTTSCISGGSSGTASSGYVLRPIRAAAAACKNPKSEWIVYPDEFSRIVLQALWDRVKARQKTRSEAIGDRVRKSYKSALRNRTGRKPLFLFSGLLRCGCGARLVISDRTHYACSSRLNGGDAACASDVRVKRTVVEGGLLRGIKSDLLTPEIIADIGREARQSLRTVARVMPAPDPRRLASVEEEIRNLVDAIASGALSASPAMAERLAKQKLRWPL